MGASGVGRQQQPSRLLALKRSGGGGSGAVWASPHFWPAVCPQGWAGTQGEGSPGALATRRAEGAEPFRAWKAHFCGRKPAVGTWCSEGRREPSSGPAVPVAGPARPLPLCRNNRCAGDGGPSSRGESSLVSAGASISSLLASDWVRPGHVARVQPMSWKSRCAGGFFEKPP